MLQVISIWLTLQDNSRAKHSNLPNVRKELQPCVNNGLMVEGTHTVWQWGKPRTEIKLCNSFRKSVLQRRYMQMAESV